VLVLEIKKGDNQLLPYGKLNKEFNDEPAALIRLGDFALFITNSYSLGQAALRCDDLSLRVHASTYEGYGVNFELFRQERAIFEIMRHHIDNSPTRLSAAYLRYL